MVTTVFSLLTKYLEKRLVEDSLIYWIYSIFIHANFRERDLI